MPIDIERLQNDTNIKEIINGINKEDLIASPLTATKDSDERESFGTSKVSQSAADASANFRMSEKEYMNYTKHGVISGVYTTKAELDRELAANKAREFSVLAISIVVALLAVYVLHRIFSSLRKSKLTDKKTSNDYNSRDYYLCEALYFKLKDKCNPELYLTNVDKMSKAAELYTLIADNRHNYAKLCEIKISAEKSLGIEIN